MPRRRARRALGLAAQVALLVVLAFVLMLRLPRVSGRSMEPGIVTDELVVIDTLAFRIGQPHAGEIVAFTHDGAIPEIYLKRIVGLPGDRIRIDGGVVSVDGAKLTEPYVTPGDTRSFGETVVPADSYYVLGDNRAASNDSRAFGTVPRSMLIGPAIFAVWPAEKIGTVR